jgi:hypothetical protein
MLSRTQRLVAIVLLLAVGAVLAEIYYAECASCNPSDVGDQETVDHLQGWGQTAAVGDLLTIVNSSTRQYQVYRLDLTPEGVYRWVGTQSGYQQLAGGYQGGGVYPESNGYGNVYGGGLLTSSEMPLELWCIDTYVGNDRYDRRCIWV